MVMQHVNVNNHNWREYNITFKPRDESHHKWTWKFTSPVWIENETRARTLVMQRGRRKCFKTQLHTCSFYTQWVVVESGLAEKDATPWNTTYCRYACGDGFYNSSLSDPRQPIIEQKTWRLGLWLVGCRMTKTQSFFSARWRWSNPWLACFLASANQQTRTVQLY